MMQTVDALSEKVLSGFEGMLSRINDPQLLVEISNLVRDRMRDLAEDTAKLHNLRELVSNGVEFKRKPEIQLEVKNQVWYALRKEDGRRFKLCDRLSQYELTLQSQRRPPEKSEFELSKAAAAEKHQQNPGCVLYWDEPFEGGLRRRFYDQLQFEAARDEWKRYMRFAKDHLTQDLGLTVDARSMIQKLEDQGYIVLPPEWA